MTAVPDRNTFESAYTGQAPWDIGRPTKMLMDVADRIAGSVLDAGCGTGENALFFAERGCQVTGIDFIELVVSEGGSSYGGFGCEKRNGGMRRQGMIGW